MAHNLLADLRRQATIERRLIMLGGRLVGPNVFVNETHAALGLTVGLIQLTPLFQFAQRPFHGAPVVVNDGQATMCVQVVRLPFDDEQEQLFRFRLFAEGEEPQSIDERGLDQDGFIVGLDPVVFLNGTIDPAETEIGLSP